MQTALQCLVVDRAERAISIADAMEFVADDRFGATDLFVGYVRCINQGRGVNGISYDMFDPLVLVKFREAADTAAREAGVACKISVAHAKGRLNVGDVAVVVAVGTGHRAAAFQICRAVIEAVKHDAPIWKQEHYIEGDSIWSEGASLRPSDESVTTTHSP